MTISLLQLKEIFNREFQNHWMLNDPAHRASHFEEVFQCGVLINDKLKLGFDPKLILFAAYFHDLFAWSRANHHILSSEFILDTCHPVITKHLDACERQLVAAACRQHRASFIGDFENQFCELINSADRGLPSPAEVAIRRAIQYRTHRSPELSEDEVKACSIAHVKEKFGTGGYARYPDLYELAFDAQLSRYRNQIDAL